MGEPLVSVVMPVCNAERFLSEAMASILGQTFRDFEFIVADFGSTDGSKEIACGFARRDSRVRLHDVGPCNLPQARNAGCSFAQGKYIAVMDGDDVAAPERLQLEVDYLENHPGVGAIGGATDWIDAAGKILRQHSFPATDSEIKSALLTHCPFCHPTGMIRRVAFEEIGGYRAVFSLAHDYDLWLRTSERFECANLADVVLQYRIHSSQVSMSKRVEQTMCILSAQASAAARRAGKRDPLDSVEKITIAELAAMGVTEAQRQSRMALELRRWIRWTCLTGEDAVALSAAVEFLKAGWTEVESWQIAELHLTTAGLYWKDGRRWESMRAVLRAVAARPLTLARPIRPLLAKLSGQQ